MECDKLKANTHEFVHAIRKQESNCIATTDVIHLKLEGHPGKLVSRGFCASPEPVIESHLTWPLASISYQTAMEIREHYHTGSSKHLNCQLTDTGVN